MANSYSKPRTPFAGSFFSAKRYFPSVPAPCSLLWHIYISFRSNPLHGLLESICALLRAQQTNVNRESTVFMASNRAMDLKIRLQDRYLQLVSEYHCHPVVLSP